jgi:hypothetical protein
VAVVLVIIAAGMIGWSAESEGIGKVLGFPAAAAAVFAALVCGGLAVGWWWRSR